MAEVDGSVAVSEVGLGPVSIGRVTPAGADGSVTVSGTGLATVSMGGVAPASEKMGTDEMAAELGMTPNAAGGKDRGNNGDRA